MGARLTQTEEQWQQVVIEYAQLMGWLVAHFRPARVGDSWRTPVAADGVGFPDLVLVRGPVLIFAELKSDTGKVRPEQQAWLDALGALDSPIATAYADAYGEAASDGIAPWPAGVKVAAVHAFVWRPRDWGVVQGVLRRVA